MTGQARNDWGQTQARAIFEGMSRDRIDLSRIKMIDVMRREDVLVIAALASTEGSDAQIVAAKRFDSNREDVGEMAKSFKAFVKEITQRRELSHPNIIKLAGLVEDMTNWTVAPWEENVNLREFLRSGNWNVPQRISLIQDTAAVLVYLHTRDPPICHGGFESPNIFVNPSKRAVITGFQETRTKRHACSSGSPRYTMVQGTKYLTAKFDPRTFSISVIGPESFLRLTAPEVRDDDLQDLPSDIWDIGWVWYEIMTCKIRFEEHHPRIPTAVRGVAETLGPIREDAQVSRAADLCNLMSDCWRFEPTERIDAATLWRKVLLISSTTSSEETSAEIEPLPANSPLELGAVLHLQGNTTTPTLSNEPVTHAAPITKAESVRADASNDPHESHSTLSEHPDGLGGARGYLGHQEVVEAPQTVPEIFSGSPNDLGGATATRGPGGSNLTPPNQRDTGSVNGQDVAQILSPVNNDPQAENCTGSLITAISESPFDSTGGACDVYEGIHKTVGRVALKCPRIKGSAAIKDIIRRFEREANTWEQLKHPHILEFLGTFERDGLFYIVSPFIIHGTIGKYIARFPSINRVKLLRQTADALHYLHSKGVVHGDVKGNNILISDSGAALLCDFSLTKVLPEVTSTLMKGAGSVRWMAPELWDNVAKSSGTDVYAFGMTIAEVLTGAKPLSHISNDVAFILAIASEDKRPEMAPRFSPSGVSYRVAWGIASECWLKDPSKRISISEVLRRFSEAGTYRGSDTDISQGVEGMSTIPDVQLKYQEEKKALKKVYEVNCRLTGPSAMSGMNTLDCLEKVSDMVSSNEEAEKAFMTAYEINNRIGSEMGSADALNGLGRTYLGQLKYEEAGRTFLEALEIYSRIDSDMGIASASDGLGRIYLAQRRHEEARGFFLEAFQIHSRVGNDVGTTDALDGLGCTYLAQRRYEEAGRAFRDALTISSRIDNDTGIANASDGLGRTYLARMRYKEAEEAFREALTIYSRIDNDTGIANASDGLGRTYLAQMRYKEAEEALREAHEINHEIGNDTGAANALDGLGHAYLAQSKYEEGMKVFEVAWAIYSQIRSHIGVGNVCRSLGWLYSHLGIYEEAIFWLTQAHTAYAADNASNSRAMGLVDLARVYHAQRRYPEAEDSVNEALGIWNSTSDRKGQAGALLLLERILSFQFKYNEAAAVLTRAEAMFSEAGSEDCRAVISSSLGCMYLARVNYADAEQWLCKARVAYTKMEDKEGETRVLESLMALYAVQDSLAQAKSICIDTHRIYAQMSMPVGEVCAKTWEFIDMSWTHNTPDWARPHQIGVSPPPQGSP